MQITYAQARIEDIDNIYGFCAQLINTYEDKDSVDCETALRWVRRKIQNSIEEYTAVYADGVKVGYYHFFLNGDLEMELDDLYIFPAYQGKGIGTEIIRKCCEAEDNVVLYAFIKNERAVALYQRMGFKITKTIGNTRCIMRKTKEKSDD